MRDESTTSTLEFEARPYLILRHTAAFTVEPVSTVTGAHAMLLEMALEHRTPDITPLKVEALAKEASPYAARVWSKLPARIREHYRALARRALLATRAMVAEAG